MPSDRPDRTELFAFYYLGFNPDGEYLKPGSILRKEFDLAGEQVELQLEANELTTESIQNRAGEILERLDDASGGRRFWEGD